LDLVVDVYGLVVDFGDDVVDLLCLVVHLNALVVELRHLVVNPVQIQSLKNAASKQFEIFRRQLSWFMYNKWCTSTNFIFFA
jgi:hypothetical protein